VSHSHLVDDARLGDKRGRFAKNVVGPLQLDASRAGASGLFASVRGQGRTPARITLGLPDHGRSASSVHANFSATDRIAHCDG
jgi:hypothetical protein